jgi:hypothetical protein
MKAGSAVAAAPLSWIDHRMGGQSRTAMEKAAAWAALLLLFGDSGGEAAPGRR